MSKKSTQTTQPNIPPQVSEAIYGAVNQGQTLYDQFKGSTAPQFTSVTPQMYNPSLTTAVTGNAVTGNAATFNAPAYVQPAMWQNGAYTATAAPVEAQTVAAQQGSKFINDYLNPYLSQVVDTSLADFDVGQSRAAAARALGNAASGAFGDLGAQGDAVFQAEALRGRGALAAGLRSQGFNTAATFGSQDANRFLQADTANQAAALQAALNNAARIDAANQFNAGVSNQINQYNTGTQNSVNQLNAAISNQTGMFNTGAQNQVNLANLAAQNQMGLANMGAINQQNQLNQSALNQAGQFNAGQGNAIGMFNAQNLFNAAQYGDQRALDAYRTYVLGPLGATQQTIGQTVRSNDGGAGWQNVAGQLAAAAIISDARMKTNINRVGTLANGLPIYTFNYKSGGPVQIGLMAQDVEQVNPDAVIEINGVKHVNYAKAVA